MGAFPVTQNEYGRGDFCFRFNKIILPKDGVRGEKMLKNAEMRENDYIKNAEMWYNADIKNAEMW